MGIANKAWALLQTLGYKLSEWGDGSFSATSVIMDPVTGSPITYSDPSAVVMSGQYPLGAVPFIAGATAATGNAALVLTAPNVAGKRFWLTNFTISGSGATAAAVLEATLAGVLNGPVKYGFGVKAGVLEANTPLDPRIVLPIPASAVGGVTGTAGQVTLSVPAFGAGNTNAQVVMQGYYLPETI